MVGGTRRPARQSGEPGSYLLSTSFGGVVPPVHDSEFVREATQLPARVAKAFDGYELHVGLADIFAFVGEANRQLARRAPWADAKTLIGELSSTDRKAISTRLCSSLSEQVFSLAIVARCLLPFLPRSAARLHEKLGVPVPKLYREPLIVGGVQTAPEAVLFPRRVLELV